MNFSSIAPHSFHNYFKKETIYSISGSSCENTLGKDYDSLFSLLSRI